MAIKGVVNKLPSQINISPYSLTYNMVKPLERFKY